MRQPTWLAKLIVLVVVVLLLRGPVTAWLTDHDVRLSAVDVMVLAAIAMVGLVLVTRPPDGASRS